MWRHYRSNSLNSLKCNNCFCFFIRRLITDSKVKLKYQHLITNSFVEVSLVFSVLDYLTSLSVFCLRQDATSWCSVSSLLLSVQPIVKVVSRSGLPPRCKGPISWRQTSQVQVWPSVLVRAADLWTVFFFFFFLLFFYFLKRLLMNSLICRVQLQLWRELARSC